MRLPLPSLPWPLPALLAWCGAWAAHAALRSAGAPALAALAAATALGALLALAQARRWRRLIVAAGFPVSALAAGLAAGTPAWAWLLPLALLALAYPARAWRDAPLFPTPDEALAGLSEVVSLAPGARVLDAGCGLGHGLAALRQAWPVARIEGIEWSWPLAALCALRCRGAGVRARVRRGDMWGADWSPYGLVYLFQRPESMARAIAKAEREMAPGAWLVSLEFEAPELAPHAQLRTPDGRALWVYRIGGPLRRPLPQIARAEADKPRDKVRNSAARRGRPTSSL